jgi:hypothetical protein
MTETKKPLEEHWKEMGDKLGVSNPALSSVMRDSFYNGAIVTLEALRAVGRDVLLREVKEYLEERAND